MKRESKKKEFYFLLLPFIVIFTCIGLLILFFLQQPDSYPGIVLCVALLLAILYTILISYRYFKKFILHLEQDMELVSREIKLDYRKGFQDSFYSRLYSKLYNIQESRKVYWEKQEEETAVLHQMISDISHQVKTPITTAKMYSQMIANMKEEDSTEKKNQYIKIVNSQISKLDFLMQALLKISRLETNIITLNPDHYNLEKILAEAYSSVLWEADKKKIDVRAEYSNNHSVYVDYKWTIEAIFNILDNAVKYSPPGGIIQVFIKDTDNFKTVCIMDHGCGIEENKIPFIFNRFYREEKSKEIEGLGLGLSLSKEIIEKQKGYIRVQSAPGKGTTFYIYLPVSRKEST